MANQITAPLASYIERARKVLQHEQRTHHQDRAIISGGLAAFTARWYEETCAICKQTGLDAGPIHRFVEHLEGYRQQDSLQRITSVQAALDVLNEIDGIYQQDTTQLTQQHTSTPTAKSRENRENRKEGSHTPPVPNEQQIQPTTGTESPTSKVDPEKETDAPRSSVDLRAIELRTP